MYNLYNTIKELCDSRGISVAQMSRDIGIHRNVMPRLKASDGKKSLSLQTLEKLAAYFEVPVSYFLDSSTDTPTEAPITDDQLLFALYGEVPENITEDDLADIRRYAAFVRERKSNKVKED